jgi:hypothetical protein
MNNYLTFYRRKELTEHCAQLKGRKSALECADLLDSARAHLASESNQQAGPSVLPSLSGKLCVDFKQKLMKENFKQTMYDYLKDKNLNAHIQSR